MASITRIKAWYITPLYTSGVPQTITPRATKEEIIIPVSEEIENEQVQIEFFASMLKRLLPKGYFVQIESVQVVS